MGFYFLIHYVYNRYRKVSTSMNEDQGCAFWGGAGVPPPNVDPELVKNWHQFGQKGCFFYFFFKICKIYIKTFVE